MHELACAKVCGTGKVNDGGMSSGSVIGKSVILVSAAVGSVVGFFELKDRFFVASDVTADPTVQMQTAPTADNYTAIRDSTAASTDEATGVKEADLTPMTETELVRSQLEQELWQRVGDQLVRFDCSEISISRLTASALVIPKADTTHGFEGHTLDGAVTLQVEETRQRLRLAGSGKGPGGAAAAVDMALRGFEEDLAESAFFKENCKGE